MQELKVSVTAFSKAVGVTVPAVIKALKSGRITAYSKAGKRVSPSFIGRRFLKLDEAKEAFRYNRVRLDADYLADMAAQPDGGRRKNESRSAQALVDAKSAKEQLQSELLRMRLDRERGESVPRAAAIAAMGTLGRSIQRAHRAIPGWAEELYGAGQIGGLQAVCALLITKSAELGNSVADLIASEATAETAADKNEREE